MGSMHTGLEARPDGMGRLAAFYAERAKGGAALIVTGGFSPNDAGNLGPHRAQFSCLEDASSPAHPRAVRTRRPHAADPARRAIRLSRAHRGAVRHQVADHSHAPREMTGRDRTDHRRLRHGQRSRARRPRRRRDHGPEGYLLTQPRARTNQRRDHGAGRSRIACASRRSSPGAAAAGADFILSIDLRARLVEGGLRGGNSGSGGVEKAGATLPIPASPARSASGHRQAVPRGAFAWATRRLARRCAFRPSPEPDQRAGGGRGHHRARRGRHGVARARCSPTRSSRQGPAGDRAGTNICIACNQACLDHYFIGQPASCVVNPRAETKLLQEIFSRKRGGGGGPAACPAPRWRSAATRSRCSRRPASSADSSTREAHPRQAGIAESIAYYAERLRRGRQGAAEPRAIR